MQASQVLAPILNKCPGCLLEEIRYLILSLSLQDPSNRRTNGRKLEDTLGISFWLFPHAWLVGSPVKDWYIMGLLPCFSFVIREVCLQGSFGIHVYRRTLVDLNEAIFPIVLTEIQILLYFWWTFAPNSNFILTGVFLHLFPDTDENQSVQAQSR